MLEIKRTLIFAVAKTLFGGASAQHEVTSIYKSKKGPRVIGTCHWASLGLYDIYRRVAGIVNDVPPSLRTSPDWEGDSDAELIHPNHI